MPVQIPPTVGRVVLFYRSKGYDPQPAIVTYVHSDQRINVATWNYDATPVSPAPTNVRLVQPGETVPDTGVYCTWMDYQIGQAGKTEELQRRLDKTDHVLEDPNQQTAERAKDYIKRAHDAQKG